VYLFLFDVLVNVDFCRLAAGAFPLRVSSPVDGGLIELVSILRQTLEVHMDVAIIPSREQTDRIEQAKAQLQALGFKDHEMQRVAREGRVSRRRRPPVAAVFSLREWQITLRSSAQPAGRSRMEFDADKIDDATLALLYLTLHDGTRAWKGHDWDTLDRLHDKGLIENPAGKAKSVVFTDEGLTRAKELFETMFAKKKT
jgi:hypothetical protein